MGYRWEIRIGTETTPRKQSALKAAFAGTMLSRHYQYIQPKYQAALYWWLRDHLPGPKSYDDIREFAEDCINDAFMRIKEYDELKKADPNYKFRSFLVKKIIFPAVEERYRKLKQEHEAIEEYFLSGRGRQKGERDYRDFVAGEFAREALLELKKTDEITYEIYIRRYFEEKTFPEIYEELKELYPLSINSIDAVKKKHKRAFDKLKHLHRELVRQGKYVDKDLPFNKFIMAKLKAETTASEASRRERESR